MRLAILIAIVWAPFASATDSKVCAQCHATVFQRYSASPMARTSAASDIRNTPLPTGAIEDRNSDTQFRLSRSTNGFTLHYAQGEAEGERAINYVVGAGVVGRSYVSSVDGFLFQAPVSHYTATNAWELSPGFEASAHLNLTRPVEPACLNCHASGLRAVAGTVNGYQTPPFDEAGVSCERCHGPGETHVNRMKTGNVRDGAAIVNPAKLPPAERDSVCGQCHLVSVIRIAKADNAPRYEPGRRLFDSTAAFLWSSGTRQAGANSHFEQLVSSACWRGSAGKLWCGTCHSAHGTSGVSYRERCVSCHTVSAPACSKPASQRLAVKDDCVACHMPARPVVTVQHAAQVDHTISRVPRKLTEESIPPDASLIPFPGSTAADRELGLAYASEALPSNNRLWGTRAFTLLKGALAGRPGDAAVAVQLGQLYDRMGQEEQACALFEQAVRENASGTAALVNLGTCRAKQGDLTAAMESWTEALRRNPGLEAARLNLAVAQSQNGQPERARENLRIALQYDPFSQRVKDALRAIPPR